MKKQEKKPAHTRKQRNIKEKHYLDSDRLDSLLEEEGRGAAAKLAAELNVEPQAISNYRRGMADPTMDNLIKIAEHYHVSVDWLLGRLPLKNKSDNEIARNAAEYTGLSTESIEQLHKWATDPDEVGIGIEGFAKYRSKYGKNYIKTVDVLVRYAGFDSLLESIYEYLKAAPEPFTVSTIEWPHEEPANKEEAGGTRKVFGTFFDYEVMINYSNGEGMLLTQKRIKDMALFDLMESAKSLNETIWKEWEEEYGKH